jgi:DNA-binding transcriptional MerR regulator
MAETLARRRPAAKPARAAAAEPAARLSAQAMVASQRDEAADSELFGIGELCAHFSITPRALRFYESKGLLRPRRIGSTRVYTRRDRARLALILRSKAIGASLTDIKHFLELYGAHGEGRVQQMKYVLERTDAALRDLAEKRAHIDATMAELRLINDAVRRGLQGKS